MILAALLLAVLPQASGPGAGALRSTAAPAHDPFTPAEVLEVRGGPTVVHLGAPGSELVAMRISIPVSEGAREAGSARLLQRIAVERVRSDADLMGAHFEGARTPWGITYSVAGPRSDLEALVALLREAVSEPDVSEPEFQSHRMELRNEVLRLAELPGERLALTLRAEAAPNAPPLEGTPASLDRVTQVTVRDLWARTHRPSQMTIVLSGELDDETIESAFRGLGASGSGGSRPGGDVPDGRMDTQVYRHWYAEAYRIQGPRDPHGAVAALLAADWLREAEAPFESAVQLWEMDDLQLLVVLAAAYSGSSVAMRQRVPRVLAETRQALTDQAVGAAAERIRQEMLARASSPVGLVDVVGRHLDATGEPAAARRYLNALDRVTAESTRAFLATLEGGSPLRAEVRP